MRLRGLFAITAAIVATGAMSLAPPAQSSSPTGGPIGSIQVGGSSANATHAVALTMTSAAAQIAVYGITTTLNCTAGSASGVVNGGGTGVSPQDGFTLTSVSLTCPSIFPGTSVSISLACSVGVVFADNNVHDGVVVGTDIIDAGNTTKVSAVYGSLRATNGSGTDCVQVTISNGCTFRVGSSTSAAFDETAKATNTQALSLSGYGLQIKSPSGCLGAVSNNQTFTLTAAFDVYSTDGLIDVQHTVVAGPLGTPIANVSVGGSSSNVNHNVNLTMKSASVSIKVYGITTNISCTAGSATGVVRGGTSGIPSYEATLTSMSVTCPTIMAGTTLAMGLACNIDLDFYDLVHTGLTDTGPATGAYHRVAGTEHLTNGAPTDCVQVSISSGCTFEVGGTPTAAFDEAIKTVSGVDYQDLTLSGSTLTIRNPSGCLGMITNGQTFTLNAVYNVQSPDGLIDFQ